jgi:hypothetical protein
MRVIITQEEILMAIEDFILDTVKVPDDIRIDISLKATRGDEGYTAEIDMVPFTSPADGSDRSVDDRIEPTEDARAEGLDIVGKIDAARSAAKAPRRRGRPVGSKNHPKVKVMTDHDNAGGTATVETPAAEMIQEAVEAHPAHEDAVQDNEAEAQVQTEVQAETQDTPEVQVDTNLTATNPPTNEELTPAVDVPATEASSQTKAKRSLFDNTTSAGDPEPEPAAEEPEPNSEQALAAEAAATEPKETVEEDDDTDYTPTPISVDPEAEGTAAPTPTRSLFANLTKPTN